MNLRVNVSEWIADSNICVGGSWFDKREVILAKDTFHVIGPKATVGFRNVCEWKEWKFEK